MYTCVDLFHPSTCYEVYLDKLFLAKLSTTSAFAEQRSGTNYYINKIS